MFISLPCALFFNLTFFYLDCTVPRIESIFLLFARGKEYVCIVDCSIPAPIYFTSCTSVRRLKFSYDLLQRYDFTAANATCTSLMYCRCPIHVLNKDYSTKNLTSLFLKSFYTSSSRDFARYLRARTQSHYAL